jgi:uncharacterized Tic20 family protein
MPNFYYTDINGQKHGLVNDQQLKALVVRGIVTPNTPLETEGGHKGTAGQIPGLFAAAPSPFTQSTQGTPASAANVASPADIQPVSAELLGMKPEVLFTFMYIAAIFSTTIIGFFIPIIIWALTKEKDRRADLHGKHIIFFTVLYEVCLLLGIVCLCIGIVGALAALIFFIYAIVLVILLIIHAFYAANGKVPVYQQVGRKWKCIWVYCPSPAASAVSMSVPQHPAVPATSTSSVDEIKKMKELLDCGAITQEEFNTFKKKTLGI